MATTADQFERYSETKKRGCPTCSGIVPKTCLRCEGKTRMCDWYYTPTGWAHVSELDSHRND